jgi:hypothetical protein
MNSPAFLNNGIVQIKVIGLDVGSLESGGILEWGVPFREALRNG